MHANPASSFISGRMRIGHAWIAAEESHPTISPATGQSIGSASLGTAGHIDDAVVAARCAAERLARLGVWDRAALCRRVGQAIAARADELAMLLANEQGKPFESEAKDEVAFAVESFEVAAEAVKHVNGTSFPLREAGRLGITALRPRGVYGVITPWNYPIAIPCAYYLAPGLAAGNALVWVPALTTSLVASLLMECLEAADLPDGAVNLVTGHGAVVGDALAGHRDVDAVGVTGSTATGRSVAMRAAGKPVSLELGGNGPTIVFADADLDLAAARICEGAFTNAGQTCTATERVLVERSVHDELRERLVARASAVVLGDPFDPATMMGPLHNQDTVDKVLAHLDDACAAGATIDCGGAVATGFATPLYFPATVVSGVGVGTLLNREETFGPVVPLLSFADEEELQAITRASRYGLFASVFTRSVDTAMRQAGRLRAGVVHINEMSAYWDLTVPGGGASGSDSGTGRIGIAQSIRAMSDEVTVTLGFG